MLTVYQSLRIWFQPKARSTAKRKLLAESLAGAPRPVTSSSSARPVWLTLVTRMALIGEGVCQPWARKIPLSWARSMRACHSAGDRRRQYGSA